MKRLPLPCALLVCAAFAAATPAPGDPPPSAPAPAFSAADQKLLDRYTAALKAKYGLASCAVENGALAVEPGGGAAKLAVDISAARSEDALEESLLAALKLEKREAGPSKTAVYFAGIKPDDLSKPESNEYKALLDLPQGRITVPGTNEPAIVLEINNGKPARRVVLRKGEDGALAATLDGEDYSFATARARAGGKTERDGGAKKGPASVFFEMNVWMQKVQKAADGRAAAERPPKLSDGGTRHPAFEALMAKVQGGLTGEKLDQAFENAGAQAPANLEARAQAARELAASGYGGAARWKINSNGKYADASGNLTLLVRGATGPGGKIEETPIVIKRGARGGYDLDAAVAPVTKLLLEGNVVAARAQAYETAAAASPSEVAAETRRAPALTLAGPGALGFARAEALTAPAAAAPSPDPALKGSLERLAAARRREQADVARVCEGRSPCVPEGRVQRPEVAVPAGPALSENVACVLNVQPGPDQADAAANARDALPEWVKDRPHYVTRGDGAYATAVGCMRTGNRGLLGASQDRAMARLRSLASCAAGGGAPRVENSYDFKTKAGDWGRCVQVLMKTGA